MRWIVLALSLGAAIMSMIHGVIAMLLSSGSAPQSTIGVPGNTAFTLLTGILLISAALLALAGGILAFNRRRFGGVLLIVAAVICIFAHRDTRIYGGIYFIGGILSFFVRRLEYEDFEEEEDDDDDDGDGDDFGDEEAEGGADPENELQSVRVLSYENRRKERAFKISKEDREEYAFKREDNSMQNEPARARSSKVCPACGASVGIDHKYCHTCGGPLHTSPSAVKAAGRLSEEPSIDDLPASLAADTLKQEEPAPFDETPAHFSSDDKVSNEDFEDDREESDEEDEDVFDDEEEEVSTPQKVFVKPVQEEQPVPARPLSINPDNSYQEFSHYTRRRKRKHHSLLRRILGPLLLFSVVSGAAWFLLGLRKLPVDELPVPVPMPIEIKTEEPSPGLNGVHLAVPNGGRVVLQDNSLPALKIEAPTRGFVLGTNVNVRSDHSTAGTVVVRANPDARVEILERWEGASGNLTGPWFQVKVAGKEGWIYGQYFQPLDARDATLPAGYTSALLKSFGATKSAAISQVGQPTKQNATILTWAGLTVAFNGDNGVTKFQISSAKHSLLNGVAVGMTSDALYRTLGYPSDYKSGQLRYLESANQGMAVRLKDDKVQNITVGSI